MTQFIFKYQLNPGADDVARVQVPVFHTLLKVGEQGGQLCAWILIDQVAEAVETLDFYIIGTGWKLPDASPDEIGEIDYVDTVFMKNGLVWHIFVR